MINVDHSEFVESSPQTTKVDFILLEKLCQEIDYDWLLSGLLDDF